ncbi:hypothetical protein G7Y89_g4550 [Cudoniella acicularis]|uniref:SET domain-containing protein n=1 Tax=Cudoniella acicularis TaxID=354080 RepID=A0A8H4W469_9HELO|nr:hypothetical protein G7Y89_g4550 [Cudoniella acicularis]
MSSSLGANTPSYTQLASALASQKHAVENAFRRKGERPKGLPVRAQCVNEFKMAALANNMRSNSTETGHVMKITVIGHPYPPSVASLQDLKKTMIEDLTLETNHRGSYLLLRFICPAMRVSAIMNIAEDEARTVVPFALHLQDPEPIRTADSILKDQSVIILKEPYFKVGANGQYFIRVDHPTDIVWLFGDNSRVPTKWRTSHANDPKSAESWKKRGDELMAKRNFFEAIAMYSRGLQCCLTTAEQESLHNGRALANLHIESFDDALNDVSIISNPDDRSKEGIYYGALALYSLERYKEALELLQILVRKYPDCTLFKGELDRTRLRITEQNGGVYDFECLYKAAKLRPPRMDNASYKGPVEVQESKGKGRGLFTMRSVQAGELLLCEKAFSYCFAVTSDEPDQISSKLLSQSSYLIDIPGNRMSVGTHADLIRDISNKLILNPSLAPAFEDLAHGEYEGVKCISVDGAPVVDTFLVANTIHINAFGCPLTSRDEVDDPDFNRDNDCNTVEQRKSARLSITGIWILASYVNHSCDLTCERSFIGDMQIVRAVRDMPANTELTFNYITRGDSAEMNKSLSQGWGFKCNCALCVDDRETSPAMKIRRTHLVRLLRSKHNHPEEGRNYHATGGNLPTSLIRSLKASDVGSPSGTSSAMASSILSGTETASSIYNPHSGVYHELHPKEIRLVTLLKGSWSDKIRCRLHQAPLPNRPVYKALSYAWGSPRATRPIIVNGYLHSVTVNLESALRRPRQVDNDLTLWIDALCINQSNFQERNSQVTLMHDIFASTEEVIVYLGEVQHHNPRALNKSGSTRTTTFTYDNHDAEKLEMFRSRSLRNTPATATGHKVRMEYSFEVFSLLRLLAAEPELDHFLAFEPNSGRFIDSEIWVIQEVVVPEKVTMVYGSSIAPWDMFVAAARWESRNRASSTPLSFPHEYSTVLSYFSRMILDIERMRRVWNSAQLTGLLPLLRRFSGRRASDDRDKVYALLSLARKQTSIKPNYFLSVPLVFQTSVLDIIKRTKSLTVLAGDLGRKDRQDLPSWVPDWSATYDGLDRRRADNSDRYNTTKNSKIYVHEQGRGRGTGIYDYLEDLPRQFDPEIISANDLVKKFSSILKTSGWTDWLPEENPNQPANGQPSSQTFYEAIEKYCISRGIAGCLRMYDNGVIDLPGLQVDEIAVVGEDVAFSEEANLSVVHSWAVLVFSWSRDKGNYEGYSWSSRNKYKHGSNGLGNAFRTMLCADIVRSGSEAKGFTDRSVEDDDHEMIAAWYLRKGGPGNYHDPYINPTLKALVEDLQNIGSLTAPETISPDINLAIWSATARRKFFITKKGYIGLGPAKLRVGDGLFMLLGGRTPFILRSAGSCRVPWNSVIPSSLGYYGSEARTVERSCFEMVGDCYAQGLMGDEAMELWTNATKDDGGRGKLSDSLKLNNYKILEEIRLRRDRLEADLAAWRKLSDRGRQIQPLERLDLAQRMKEYLGYLGSVDEGLVEIDIESTKVRMDSVEDQIRRIDEATPQTRCYIV